MRSESRFLDLPEGHVIATLRFFTAVETMRFGDDGRGLDNIDLTGYYGATETGWQPRTALHVLRTMLSLAWEKVITEPTGQVFDGCPPVSEMESTTRTFIAGLHSLEAHPDFSTAEVTDVLHICDTLGQQPIRQRWVTVYWLAHHLVDWFRSLTTPEGFPVPRE